MSNQVVGYIRVSTSEQNPDRQLFDIELDKKFIDYYTGKARERPELNKCIEYVREGDTVIVHSIDRLARDLRDLQAIVNKLIEKGVIVKFLKENLTFTSNDDPIANFTLQIMGSFAEFERSMIKIRQKEGIEAARISGKHLGRPKKINDKFKEEVKEKLSSGQSIRSVAKDMDVSRATIYKVINIKRDYEVVI